MAFEKMNEYILYYLEISRTIGQIGTITKFYLQYEFFSENIKLYTWNWKNNCLNWYENFNVWRWESVLPKHMKLHCADYWKRTIEKAHMNIYVYGLAKGFKKKLRVILACSPGYQKIRLDENVYTCPPGVSQTI